MRVGNFNDVPKGCFLYEPTGDTGSVVFFNTRNHEFVSPIANSLCKKNEGKIKLVIYKIYILHQIFMQINIIMFIKTNVISFFY